MLNEAIELACKAHDGQKRKGSSLPYIIHPLDTVAIAATMTDDEDVLCAAVLHDLPEDTGVTLSDISARFGSRVGELVGWCTEEKHRELPPEETWQARKAAAVSAAGNAPRDAKIVILSDKLANLRSLYADFKRLGDSVWERFNQTDPDAHSWYYREMLACLSGFDNEPAYDEYELLCKKIFGSNMDL